jgi:hypothetical protein
MAYAALEAAANDGVQFRVTHARRGATKVRDPLWDRTQFEDVYAKLQGTALEREKSETEPDRHHKPGSEEQLLSAYAYGSLMSANVAAAATDRPPHVHQNGDGSPSKGQWETERRLAPITSMRRYCTRNA